MQIKLFSTILNYRGRRLSIEQRGHLQLTGHKWQPPTGPRRGSSARLSGPISPSSVYQRQLACVNIHPVSMRGGDGKSFLKEEKRPN